VAPSLSLYTSFMKGLRNVYDGADVIEGWWAENQRKTVHK